jgi:ABC-type sugar transport system substrate-binding protein
MVEDAELEVVEVASAEEAPRPVCMIVFDSDRDGNREVYIMGPDGSHQTNLTNHGADDFDPVWSPDGSAIAFVSNRESDQGGGQFIYTMAADGSGLFQLSTLSDGKMPDWSPEGSQIAFSHNDDIYAINTDGSGETNLTNSPEQDMHPKFSPDGQRIAWIKGNEEGTFIYLMNADGSNPQQVTNGGEVFDLEWTVDGRIFTHWNNPDGICGNCVVSTDGSEVVDAGGKGAIQEFLPFWTLDGQRVEMISGQVPDVGGEDDEIYLVGENFPDIFLNLTDNEAQDGNPDAPALCGPGEVSASEGQAQSQAAQPTGSGDMVIGYVIRGDNPRKEEQILKACGELKIDCVRGENVSQLTEQNVSAIVDVSNRWEVLGSWPELHAASEKSILLFIVDAETNVNSAYNLSVESDAVHISLEWMFKQMGGEGEMVYYNFGNNGYHQELIDAELEKSPGIRATSLPADFGKENYTEDSIAQMVRKNPKLEAIWSNGDNGAIFWGLNNMRDQQKLPLFISPNREDFLQFWKERIDLDPAFSGISTIAPGGAAYEGVYVAYYMLSGAEIDPQMLTGAYGNTLRYDFPVITNENLEEWLGRLDTLQRGEWDMLEIPPMTPEEIRDHWFVD